MRQKIVTSRLNQVRATRRWATAAFIAGMMFTAALLLTFSPADGSAPGMKYQPTPAGKPDSPKPDNDYLKDGNTYGLVNICPLRETSEAG